MLHCPLSGVEQRLIARALLINEGVILFHFQDSALRALAMIPTSVDLIQRPGAARSPKTARITFQHWQGRSFIFSRF